MKENKQKEFLALYEPVHARFERFCRARVYGGMEYEDLMNETILVALEKLGTEKNPEAFLSYLIGIAIRILANASRKHKAETGVDEMVLTNVIDPGNETDHRAEIDLLYQTMTLLPDDQREALILFEITGFSIKEIAKIQDTGESAVKARLTRGRKNLASLLSDQKKEVA